MSNIASISNGLPPASGSAAGDFQVSHDDWKQPASSQAWAYPAAPMVGGVTEMIHGLEIKDPWRGLENLETSETQEYIKALNAQSQPYLHSHPKRADLEHAIEKSLSYVRTTCPHQQVDGYYYWLYSDGSFQRDIMVRSRDLARDFGKPAGKGGPQVIFDPNLEEDVSLYMYSWSPSGRLLSLILQEKGSDWQNIRTIDVETGKKVDEELRWSKFTFGATFVGEQGLLYKRIIGGPSPTGISGAADGQFGIWYHKFGTPQTDDVLIWYERNVVTAPSLFIGRPGIISEDEREGSGRRAWLYLDIYRNTNPETENLIVELPCGTESEAIGEIGKDIPELVSDKRRWLNKGYTGDLQYIGTLSDDRALFRSTADGCAPGRVVSFDLSEWDAGEPDSAVPATEVVPADPEGHLLQSAHLIAQKVLVLVYLRHSCAAVVFVDALTGQPIGSTDPRGSRGEVVADGPIDLPVPNQQIKHHAKPPVLIPKHASISTVTSRPDSRDFYMAIDTFIAAPYVLAGKLSEGPHGLEVDVHGLGEATEKTEDLVCRQVFYDSHDGIKIPMFISHRADLDTSIPQPSLLYAYGGYAHPLLPHFDPCFVSFMRNLGGVLAVANIRGGGEYGKPWHEAAKGIKRTVAWDDHAWAAKYLHAIGISAPRLTTTLGTSNGGLLVSASMLRHPELYGAVIPDVAVEDLIRYHKFTMGRVWMSEFGSPDDPEILPHLAKLSPLHNVDPDPDVTYPAVMVVTGDHDTRVIPGHSLKFIAELQDKKTQNKNALIARVYENAGHEAGSKSIKQKVEEAVDRLVFILLSIEAPQGSEA